MGRTISIGNQGFPDLRENDCFYIDKTDLIREWWESKDKVTLITRPRRFGKTLNMSMLECFFSVKYKDRSDLFEGLKIWEEEKYRKLQGTYPVICLSFASAKSSDFDTLMAQIYAQIYNVYTDFRFLLKADFMTAADQKRFDAVNYEMNRETAVNALTDLCKWLSLYYRKNTIVLLDEYDTPVQEAWRSQNWDGMADFIRSFFNAAFKTNPYLERGLMTGITRVSKESIFSDLNNLKVVTTTSNSYTTAFGFTEEEVFAALDENGLSREKEEVKHWYDGFTFGSQKDIYNPWSITNFLKEKEYASYWADTSSNGLVSDLLREGDKETKTELEALLRGEALEKVIDEQIIFSQLGKEKNALWSLLLASGYLKVESCREEGLFRQKVCALSITNLETLAMFHKLVKNWFACDSSYNEFIRALLRNDVKGMNVYMNRVALSTFSSFDVGGRPSESMEPERFYHGFVLGLLVELRGRYEVRSNRESGFGRCDVMLVPLKNAEDNAYVLEFKVQDSAKEADLKKTVTAAKRQITKKKYVQELLDRGIPKEKIFRYGFAFCGKTVLIG